MQPKKTKIGCPTHGLKHMIWVGASYYCAAPTPGEVASKCFYHPRVQKRKKVENKGLEKKRKEEEKAKKPDIFKMIEKEHIKRQKNKVLNREIQRKKALEKLIPAY